MKIIFLDIDGVLNHQLWYKSQAFLSIKKDTIQEYEFAQFCPDTVNILNHMTDKTEAKIVISSSWRTGRSVEELIDLSKKVGIKGSVIDKTPHLSFDDKEYGYSVPRGCEIKAWMELNKGILGDKISMVKYVILDDDSDMLYWQRNNFVHIDNYCGLTHNQAHKAINILNK